MAVPQSYPRDEEGFIDVDRLAQHSQKIPEAALKDIIRQAIAKAAKKTRRAILDIPASATAEERLKLFRLKGAALFQYFRKYYGDPATTAFDCFGRHYAVIAREQFRNQTLQKERMNSGWRYQFIAKDCAVRSNRFVTVSDIGAAEADFNVTVDVLDKSEDLSIYVSIKNRANTMGGQDWPKAIHALEDVARTDKNRTGPYLCVFGIVIERGARLIRRNGKSKNPHSVNTEIWLSDFFWPFFANYSYAEIAKAVLSVLMEDGHKAHVDDEAYIPSELIDAFGAECTRHNLIDAAGQFNDPLRLVEFFCSPTRQV